MKITYGTRTEQFLLCGLFLSAAAAALAAFHLEGLLTFPYLSLPVYLALCSFVLAVLARGQTAGDFLSRWLYRVLPALFLMSAIFHASSLTFPPGPIPGRTDVLFHFAEFLALGLLTARMVAPDMNGKLSRRSFLLAASIVLGYGLLDEIHQSFVPDRDPSVLDFLFDAAGGLLGILIYPVLFTGSGRE